MAKLTGEQVGNFDLNGFLVLDGILDEHDCRTAVQMFKKYADDKFSAIINLDRTEAFAKELVTLPSVVEAVEQLQRWEVDAVMTQILFKEAGSVYRTQAWNPHQDNSYPQIPYHGIVTTNLFFADADPENGGMYLYPKSHREPLLQFEPTPSHKEKPGTNPGNTVEVPPQYKKIDLIVKAGSLLVMNTHLLHGSYPNNSPTRSRPLYSVSYVNKGLEVPYGVNAKRMRLPVRPHCQKYFRAL